MIICVDLDGTLIRSDTLHELFLQLIKRNPLYVFLCFFWILRGRAYFKQQISKRVLLVVDTLPYHQELLHWLKEKKQTGNTLILITAADHTIANSISNYLGIFDETFGSDGQHNLKGTHKRDFLNARYNEKQYGYIGNSRADLPIWKSAKIRGVVNAPQSLYRQVERLGAVELFIPKSRITFKKWLKVFRVHQYVKNVLIFLPWLLAHSFSDLNSFWLTCLGFASFSLLASSVYMTNDLLDLTADRRHDSKCKRAFAAGDIPITTGISLSLTCLVIAIALACCMPWQFRLVLFGYYLVTCLYSFALKQLTLIDVYTLATLYTFRIFAGMAILTAGYSSWLILFSFFFFTSLAFVKRFTELFTASKKTNQVLHGRGYHVDHLISVKMFGISSAFVSVMVFGLYLNSYRASASYHHPQLLYALCPVLLYWLSRIWLKASEGKVHDDPIIYAIKDKVSYGVIIVIIMITIIATI